MIIIANENTIMEKVSDQLQHWMIISEDALNDGHHGGLDHSVAIRRLDELGRIPVQMGVQIKAREVRTALAESNKRNGHKWLSIACNDFSVLRTTVASRALHALRDRGE